MIEATIFFFPLQFLSSVQYLYDEAFLEHNLSLSILVKGGGGAIPGRSEKPMKCLRDDLHASAATDGSTGGNRETVELDSVLWTPAAENEGEDAMAHGGAVGKEGLMTS